ncbi:MAG: hypothetical protein ACLVHU_00490 [Bifidobacterium adolescentis]
MNPTTMCGQCAYGFAAVLVFVGAWILSIFSYGSRWLAVERGCPAEQPDFWLFVGTAGQWEVF